jgi:ERF superfamily
MSDGENKSKLFEKLAAVMGELSRVEKEGTNTFHNYRFATDSAVADAVRPLLSKHGIALWVTMVDQTREAVIIPTKSGERSSVRYTVTLEFTFGCAETGATITSRWVGEALDTEDKGFNKCVTAAEKYFFLKTFALSTGDDPDGDSPTPAPAPKRQQSPAKTQQQETFQPPADGPVNPDTEHWITLPGALQKMVKWAHGEVWNADPITLPHAQNRVAKALGCTNYAAIVTEYRGTKEDAIALIKAYPTDGQS